MNWRKPGAAKKATAAGHPMVYAVPSAVDLLNCSNSTSQGISVGEAELALVAGALVSVDGETLPTDRAERLQKLQGCPDPAFIHEAFAIIYEDAGTDLGN